MRLIYSKYINVLLTIISFSPIPSQNTLYFLPFIPISTKRPLFLPARHVINHRKNVNKHHHLTSHEIHLLQVWYVFGKLFMSGLFCNKKNECNMSIVMTATCFFFVFFWNNGFFQGTSEGSDGGGCKLWGRPQIKPN